MKCSVCSQEMKIKNKEISNNQKQGEEFKEYHRVLYWCGVDDVWISVESPLVAPQNLE